MSVFRPESYAEALQNRAERPRKPRTPLRSPRAVQTRLSAAPTRQNVLRRRRTKKLTDGQLKKRVWKEFSIYIRTKDADEEGMVLCATCPTRSHWKTMQAGHFIRGRLNSNLLDERGVAPQCYGCNIHRQGNVVIYYKMMLLRYGQDVIDELLAQNNQTKKWQAGELQGLLDHYKAKNAAHPLVQEEKRKRDQRGRTEASENSRGRSLI